jgi:hypothetical protein
MVMGLAGVLGLEVLMRVVRMTISRVIVLVVMPEAEVLERVPVREEVVRHVIVLVGVRYGLMRVLVVGGS